MERTYLKDKILLASESDGQMFKRTFTIVRKLNEGSMAIGYEAYHDTSSTRGVLREFYPNNAFVLERDINGQLIASDAFEEAKNRYIEARTRYENSYRRLAEAIRTSEDQNFSKYLPVFEIYRGIDKDMNPIGTTYIWTPEDKLSTFDSLCKENHRHPKSSPEYKLVSSLKAVETLTKATMALHMAGFIHRDIKPSNFGFQMSENKVLTESFKLFDVDTVCPATRRKFDEAVYSEGFTESEATTLRPSTMTDIYSIGATLFNAIIVTPETKENDYLYNDSFFDRIDELVNTSTLISCSESNSHPRLRYLLSKILKGCLAKRSARYEKCEDLLKDLNDALFYALPGEITNNSTSREKWVLKDLKSTLDKKTSKNSYIPIINHLYDYPIYLGMDKNSPLINVLLLGFGEYSQKFLDVILSTVQMKDKKLNVVILSEVVLDFNLYLEERPELSSFFDINKKVIASNSYGSISFENKSVEEYLQENSKIDYAFVSIGTNKENLNAAKKLHRLTKVNVAFILENDEAGSINNSSKGLYPLYINDKNFKNNPELERMAFNVHLLWEKNLNIDFLKIHKQYMERYNHISSLCCVLSMKYKLYSIGIDLNKMSFEEAAYKFNENKEFKEELIYLEHLRWVSEKICLGWKKRDLNLALDGITRDYKNKNHICILRSERNQLLSEYTDKYGLSFWDDAKEELDLLDELDLMSVNLHRLYKKKADAINLTSLFTSSEVNGIYNLIEDNRSVVSSFQEYLSVLKEITSDSIITINSKLNLVRGLKDNFLRLCKESFDEYIFGNISKLLTEYDAKLSPILLSKEYRNYKADDAVIINNIPFILTYVDKFSLVIPYDYSSKENVFRNVASASFINPCLVTYIVDIKSKNDLKKFMDTTPKAISFMDRKNLNTSVEFVIFYDKKANQYLDKAFERELLNIGGNRVKSVKRVPYSDSSTCIKTISEVISKKAIKNKYLYIEKNDSPSWKLISSIPEYDKYEVYEFDLKNIKFNTNSGTSVFNYISKKPSFTVLEALSFENQKMELIKQPEFYNDYKDLWNFYTANESYWCELVSSIRKYSLNNDLVAVFKKNSYKSNKAETVAYVIPHFCSDNAQRVINCLKTNGVIGNGSNLMGYTSGSVLVNLVINSNDSDLKESLDDVFSDYNLLSISDNLVIDATSDEIKVSINSLKVSGLTLKKADAKKIEAVLNYLNEKHFISSYKVINNKAKFSFATDSVKKLLSDEDEIKRVYMYHMMKESDKYDDVLYVNNSTADIIATTDFSLVLVHV